MTGITFLAVYATSALILLFVVVAFVRRSRPSRPAAEMAPLLQRAWRTPILEDAELAERIAEITLTPIVKQDYRTELVVSVDHLATAERMALPGGGQIVVHLRIETSFSFENLTARDLPLRIAQSAGDLEDVIQRGTLSSVTVDGQPIEAGRTTDDETDSYEILVPARGRSAITATANCRSTLPLIVEIPQTVAVRSGARLRVVSHVQGRIGLMVTGSPDCSFRQDYYDKMAPLDIERTTLKPLLPGESIMLFIGAGRAALPGRSLFDPPVSL